MLQPQDFDVKYRIYSEEEGGRESLPYQGIRWDFAFKNDLTNNYMIYPEFEDCEGNVILDIRKVRSEGTARMWIVSHEIRKKFIETRLK
ncbi:hypothetical protein [Mechercharimyces sp. CAU 1602]|uniref:hypothetical protein n=1 Tax=Mechercharimyces sp. CAU 1602 TaxID=2973933 RepID=UPI002162501D|nr:hypothetical protein [Mechercharimyces sp. CAU 1602]MCS1350891.1 hypothetical protein [Mechercharimyces sp. CAU 1602]